MGRVGGLACLQARQSAHAQSPHSKGNQQINKSTNLFIITTQNLTFDVKYLKAKKFCKS